MKNIIKQTALCLFLAVLCTHVNANSPYTQQVIINEINYRSVELQQDIDFIELYNVSNSTINISGWKLTEGISYVFPAGTSISPGNFITVCGDPATCESVLGFSNAMGPYAGALSSNGDEIVLKDNNFLEVDKVDYESWKEWPNVRYNDYVTIEPNPYNAAYTGNVKNKVAISIQKINPYLDGKHGGSWGAASPTPQAQNTTYRSDHTIIPVIKSVSKSPDKPLSGQEVRIKADFDNDSLYASIMAVELEYQIVDAGNYIDKSDPAYANTWTSIPMLDDGVGADSTANNGLYTALIPASIQANRRLVRYRVKVTTTNGFSKIYPDQNHTESNYAYYVYDGDADFNGYSFASLNPLQNVTIITKTTTADTYIGNGSTNLGQFTGKEYLGEGTLIYNGKIYDHVRFRPRGKTRPPRIKPGIKFDMNSEKKIAVIDDCGEEYDVERGNFVLSGTWVNDAGSHGLVENMLYKILELTGSIYKSADYTSLRIVDEATEANDFWGLYVILEDYDQDLLEEHGLPEGNIWATYDPVGAPRFMYVDSYGDFSGSVGQDEWVWAGSNTNIIPPVESLNKGMFYGDWIANEFWANGESNYVAKHSYREYYNPETGEWHGWCTDYDGAFGSGNNVVAVSTTAIADSSANIRQPLRIPVELQIEYKGALRSAYDLLLNQQQIEYLIDSESEKIYTPGAAYDWTTVDHSRWDAYQVYSEGNVDNQFAWYKGWFRDRADYLMADSIHGIMDSAIPETPTISLGGGLALDELTFDNSLFADPQGAGTFAALEWRVGEWSDPANPVYADICEAIYEIQTVWSSGEISTFSSSFTIPGTAALQAGRTYKVRVRYKDDTGRWSHWSEPVQIVPDPANDNTTPELVINEIMYNPIGTCGGEYIEIKNAGSNIVALDGYKFTDGIEYDFADGSSIPAGGLIVLARDSMEFVQRYGFAPFGDYGGSLSNDGEKLELRGLYNRIVDSLTYDDSNPWDEAPDGFGPSLELLSTSYDNSLFESWFRSDDVCGTPGSENSGVCSGTAEAIVINEINYNSNNGVTDPGDWVELYNPNPNPVDISGWTFHDNGNTFKIPAGTSIEAEDFLVLVEDETMFSPTFTHLTSDQYLGNFTFGLSNKGERVSLFDENKCLSDFLVFDDNAPWDTIPDGNGPTLSLITPDLDNTLPGSWEGSSNINSAYGTPGRPNTPCPESTFGIPSPICVGFPATITIDSLYPGMTVNWLSFGVVADSLEATWNSPGVKTIQILTRYFECTKIYTQQVTVVDCNDSPIALNDDFLIIEDNPLNEVISLNDTDPDGDDLMWSTTPVNEPANGTVTINDDGTFTYEPDLDFSGNDSFTYEVCDNIVNDITISKTFRGQVSSGADDVEEFAASGNIKVSSGDLDLMDDNGTVFSAVGIRIADIRIPNNANITNAYFQFVADETNEEATSLTISAEAVGNAQPIPTDAYAITSKIKTNASANWSEIPTWTAGNTYLSDDISVVIQELVNRPDWQNGNAMTFIFEGTGTRTPEAFEGGWIVAPKLVVDYEVVGEPQDISLCDQAEVNIIVEQGCVDAYIYAFLEGPFDSLATEMKTTLNTERGVLPGQTPSSDLVSATPAGQPYNIIPWNYGGTEGTGWTDANYTSDMVDWVLVSTRTDIDKSSEVGRAAGILHKDGAITFPEGCVLENIGVDSVYIVVEHRNHMGIMSPTKVPVDNLSITWDFRFTDSYRDPTSVGQKSIGEEAWVMFGGDGDQSDAPSYDIKSTDKYAWLDGNGLFNQYNQVDYNLDGDTNGGDKLIWNENNGVSSRVPK